MVKYFPTFTLRLPETLLNKLKKIAEENGRSANKEIEQIVKKHVKEYEDKHGEIQVEEY